MSQIRRTYPLFALRHLAFSWPVSLLFWALKIIIYRLLMSTFGREMSVANVRPPDGLGLPHQTEEMAHWVDILGHLSRLT